MAMGEKQVSKDIKPAPQTVSVDGFNALMAKYDINRIPKKSKINWARLLTLPSYHMFLIETGSEPQTGSIEKWALAATNDKLTNKKEKEFYQEYCDWHKAKGYWPNETPMGELLGE